MSVGSPQLVHALDPKDPVLVLQAPRGTAADNAVYDPCLDITGMDVFPVGMAPGDKIFTNTARLTHRSQTAMLILCLQH